MSVYVRQVVEFNSHTQARDKFYRVVQYGSRLVLWHLSRTQSGKVLLVQRLKYLEEALSVSRKLFRMGNSVDLLQKALAALSLKHQGLMVLTFSAHFFKGLWLVIDHALWFGKIKVVQMDMAFWSRWSLRAWLVALVSAVAVNTMKLSALQRKMARDGKEGGPHSAGRELQEAQLTLLRDLCDLCIPLSGLGYTSPGLGAAGGVVSSVIGFRQEWQKHIGKV